MNVNVIKGLKLSYVIKLYDHVHIWEIRVYDGYWGWEKCLLDMIGMRCVKMSLNWTSMNLIWCSHIKIMSRWMLELWWGDL